MTDVNATVAPGRFSTGAPERRRARAANGAARADDRGSSASAGGPTPNRERVA